MDSYEKELLAQLMIKHGFSTGHGDTFEDLLEEFDWQLTERNEKAKA